MTVVITLWILGMILISLYGQVRGQSDLSVPQTLMLLLGVILISTLSIVNI
jgi:hypothetical protein